MSTARSSSRYSSSMLRGASVAITRVSISWSCSLTPEQPRIASSGGRSTLLATASSSADASARTCPAPRPCSSTCWMAIRNNA
ncbi:Uncharacterised protein [Bordetella pertussis]|nr:Uncharacterised protein [Bordetella pertussis]CFW48662.1 Uncharacterised protein [Bordetella pertussis]